MAEAEAEPLDEGMPEAESSPGSSRFTRWRRFILLSLLAAFLALASVFVWLDTPSGHRFAAGRIAQLDLGSGLRLEIGRIDGSLYRKAVLHDVRLSDPQGVFLSAPEVRLRWWPASWFSNRLDIDELLIPRARLHRLPHLRPTKKKRSILPDFDIRLMQFEVNRLELDRAVTGREDIVSLEGDADIRNGTATVDFAARSLRAGDRLLLALDARPDDNRFDIDLTVNAPTGGFLATLAGLRQDSNLRITGKGDWDKWHGKLIATLDRKSAAGFDIRLRRGHYKIQGIVEGSAIASNGALARLTSPNMRVKAEGDYADKLLSGQLLAESDAIALDLKGGVHLGGRGYDNLLVDLSLRRPQALLKNFDARGLVARVRLNGPADTARFEYLLRAQTLSFGRTRIVGVRAIGEGHFGGAGNATLIPLDLSADSVDGQGDLVAQILHRVSVRGMLQKKGNILTSAPLKLRSDKIDGELLALFDLKAGRCDLALSGDVRGVTIAGLGVVDLRTRIKAAPAANGAFGLTGRAEAVMRRLDNGFLRSLGGGLPSVQSDIALDASGRLTLRHLSLRSPLLTLNGEGVRTPDGSVRITGSGTHRTYGPVKLMLSGNISRPAVDAVLARPLDAAGLADVHLSLAPDAQGYSYTASGQSTLGPFVSNGRIDLPPGGAAAISVAALKVNGAEGEGKLLVVPGGLSGTLQFAGSARGPIDLTVENGVQHAQANLRIDNAHFEGMTPIDVSRGRLTAELILGPDGTKINATFRGTGLQVARMRINRFVVNAQLVDGEGKVRANVTGQRGRQFNLQLDADVAHDAVDFDLGGTLDGQAVSLDRRARLRRIEGGWALDPVALRYRGGTARVDSAAFGSETRFDMRLSQIPLSMLDLGNVDLGLGGTASGVLHYAQRRGSAPEGTASITVKNLTRSGVTRTSTPIDLGLNGELTSVRLAARVVAQQKGQVIGRGQVLMTPLGQGNLIERLRAAPMRAQLRYAGPADAVWRLSTIEIVDLQGRVAMTADIGGTGADPVINGQLMTADAALESPITGMRLSHVRSRARFDGSRLVFSEMSGVTANGGQVSGQGSFDFAIGEGVGIDLAFTAKNAELLDRDDIGAIVNGPITIRSDGKGGTISGDFDVVSSRFMLGRAAEVAEIPELQLIEINGRQDNSLPSRGVDWRLDIKANARNRLAVSGMGLSSEWRMNLDIGGSVASPVLIGRADLVRGSYDFAGRRFDLTSGSLRFDGSVPANPTLDITAQASVSGLDATIRITGTSAAPEISFSSNPALPQEEVLSRILFGSSITQLSAPEALQLAASVSALRGSGGGLDPINAVRKAAGLDRLRILPADPTTGQGTSIGAGKYVTRRIYVEVITDGQGYSATRTEYQITRWLSLLSSISTIGRQSAALRVSKDY